jgi:hypothetical protein
MGAPLDQCQETAPRVQKLCAGYVLIAIPHEAVNLMCYKVASTLFWNALSSRRLISTVGKLKCARTFASAICRRQTELQIIRNRKKSHNSVVPSGR